MHTTCPTELSTNPSLSIIIVNWNVAPLLERCLDSIFQHCALPHFEVIVVDNGSTDHSLTMMRARFPQVHVIANSDNRGFAKANNQGFQIAKGTYVLTLNPDTTVNAAAIQKNIALLEENPQIGIVGPRILDSNGQIVRACRRDQPSNWEIAKGLFLTDKVLDKLMRTIFPTRWATFADYRYFQTGTCECLQGSFMLMRLKDLQKVGFFDERIPLYLDDNDLCKRFQDQGLEIFYNANTEIVHHGAQSVSKMPNSRMSSLVGSLAIDTYFLKHGSVWQVALYHCQLFASSILFLLVDLILFPVLIFFKPKFIRNYFIKHWWSLSYSIFFCFRTNALPLSWPRSLRQVMRAKENQVPIASSTS